MCKPIFTFIFCALKPLSKTADVWDIKDIIQAVAILVGWGGGGGWTLTTNTNIAVWVLAGIPALLFLIAGIKLQFRLVAFKGEMPQLRASLLSFPISGYRIVKSDKLLAPQTGYAKIIIRNTGGLLEDCIGTVTGISKVNVVRGKVEIMPLVFTSSNLFWDNGEISRNIPNDKVDRYLNLAYLDQNKPNAWQLAIDESRREDYFTGWHKIDLVISSLKTKLEPMKVEVALGFGGREDPQAPLNLWSWDKWYQDVQKRLQQAPDREDFQLE